MIYVQKIPNFLTEPGNKFGNTGMKIRELSSGNNIFV